MTEPDSVHRLLRRPHRQRRHYHAPLAVIMIIVLITLLAPALAPYDPRHAVSGGYLLPPSAEHIFGTDTLGRDVLSRTLWGGRQTLSTALLATAITIIPGLLIGAVSGFTGHWVDRAMMAAMDTLLAFPNLLLALVIIALIGTGANQVALSVGMAGLPAFARVARAAVLDARHRLYVQAAWAIGAPPHRVLIHHILPNIMETLLSFAAVSLSWALLNGTALFFLGFGGDPSIPDWGVMLNEGRAAFRVAPWIALPPGMTITLTVFAVNRIADSWQDALNGR